MTEPAKHHFAGIETYVVNAHIIRVGGASLQRCNMVGSFFPRASFRADFGSGSGGGSLPSDNPGVLTRKIGSIAHIALHDFERERAKLFFETCARVSGLAC
ncbi:hypothetical protein BPNPMPFG_007869 (plasmid) [Mesorhizobium sp. AR07]|uniref:hypothetical protein n=1 Tax=Mesorhizobium sp. AR07 TaxID=2865838 RepID=UPI00215E51EB|nr:hypothetical protein [Mesorhizobium sp. AR07]UVK48488.1 hypothetical protein BPNPMPFG_007869 [Mesorhizobium sp. AR07]